MFEELHEKVLKFLECQLAFVEFVWLLEIGSVFAFFRRGYYKEAIRFQCAPDILKEVDLIVFIKVLEYLKAHGYIEEVRCMAEGIAAPYFKRKVGMIGVLLPRVFDRTGIAVDRNDLGGTFRQECAAVPLTTSNVQHLLAICQAGGEAIPVIVLQREDWIRKVRNKPLSRELKLPLFAGFG